jgi:hypothetical protein
VVVRSRSSPIEDPIVIEQIPSSHSPCTTSLTELARYFHLDDADRSHLRRIRGNRNRLGFALQLCTIRFLGTLLPNPAKTLSGVIDHVAGQLKIRNVQNLAQYADESTRWRHAERIKAW